MLEILKNALERLAALGGVCGEPRGDLAGPHVGHHPVPFGVFEVLGDPAPNPRKVFSKIAVVIHDMKSWPGARRTPPYPLRARTPRKI